MASGASHHPLNRAGRCSGRSRSNRARRLEPIEKHRLEKMIRADIAGFGRQEKGDRQQADRRSGVGPGYPSEAIDGREVAER